MSDAPCVVGIDFGTDSVRSIIADATTGSVLGTSVKYYPRWAKGLYCDPVENRFRQHPLDYLESMEASLMRGAPTRPVPAVPAAGAWHRRRHHRFHAGAGGPLGQAAGAQRAVRREPERDVRSLEGPHGRRRGRTPEPPRANVGRRRLHEVRRRDLFVGVVLGQGDSHPRDRPGRGGGCGHHPRALRLDPGGAHRHHRPRAHASAAVARPGTRRCGTRSSAATRPTRSSPS